MGLTGSWVEHFSRWCLVAEAQGPKVRVAEEDALMAWLWWTTLHHFPVKLIPKAILEPAQFQGGNDFPLIPLWKEVQRICGLV